MISFVKVTLTSLSTKVRTVLAQIRGAGATGADDDAEPMDGVEVNTPIGFDSRPVLTDTTELLTFRIGAQIVGLYIIDKGRADKLDDPELEEGETRVSGAKESSAMLRVRADGDLVSLAKSGKVVSLGVEVADGKWIIGDGEALRTMLLHIKTMENDIKAQLNQLRTDFNAQSASVTSDYSGSPLSVSWSAGKPTSASAVAEADIEDPPALSSKVKAL